MGKKLLKTFSTMIALCLLMAMFSISALAAGTSLPDADSEGVITLTEDVTIDSWTVTDGTIDLNGYTLTYTGTTSVTVSGAESLTITDSTGDGTLVMDPGITNSKCYFVAEGSLTLENITVTSTGSVVYAKGDGTDTSPSKVVIDNCYISTTGVYCVRTNANQSGGKSLYSGVDITIKNSTVMTEATDGDDCTVMINVDGSLTIENSYIVGDRQAVVVRAGNATITDSTLIVTGEDNTTTGWGDYYGGYTSDSESWGQENEFPSAALLVGSYNGIYYGDADVTVENSTIASLSDDSAAIYAESNKDTSATGASELYTSTVTLTGDDTVVTGTVKTGKATTTDEKTGETVSASTIAITGGTYDSDVSKYLDDSVVTYVVTTTITEDEETGEEVTTTTYSYYTDTEEAIAAAEASEDDTSVYLVTSDTCEDGSTHTYEYTGWMVEKTCTTSGIRRYTCTNCGKNKYVVVAASHDWEEIEGNSTATCGEAGEAYFYCPTCGEYEWLEVEATGDHNYVESLAEADCTHNQRITMVCSVCGQADPDAESVDVEGGDKASGHDYEVTSAVLADGSATCTEGVVVTYVCNNCGDTQTNTVNQHCRTYEASADENEDGTITFTFDFTCTICGDTSSRTNDTNNSGNSKVKITSEHVDATDEAEGGTLYTATTGYYNEFGVVDTATCEYLTDIEHNWVYDSVVYATCTENGGIQYKCSNCDETYIDYFDDDDEVDESYITQGHQYELTDDYYVAEPATCLGAGYWAYRCTVCGEEAKEGDTIPVEDEGGEVVDEPLYGTITLEEGEDGHSYVTVNVLKEADCSEGTTGVEKVECEYCGATKYQVISADHTPGDIVETTATCTEAGETTYICEVCGEEYTVDVDALGHDYVETVTKEATCGEAGEATYTCSVCGDTYIDEIEATGEHDYVETVTEATCTENMKAGYFCSVCGAEDPDNPAEEIEDSALGHTESELTYVDPTCIENAKAVVYCTVCEETLEEADLYEETGMEEYQATGHDYEAVVTEPTCVEGGYTTYTCTVCDDTYTADETDVDSTAHDYELVSTLKEATCTTTGVGKYTCTLCGTTKYRVIPASHTWDEGTVTAEATCYETGSITYTCTACGEEYVEVTPMVDHISGEAVVENYVAPTATTDGSYDLVVYCTVCGAVISSEHYTVPAGSECEHENLSLVGEEEATCTTDGYTGDWVCDDCGETISVGAVIPATGHSYDEGVVTKEATCLEAGVMTYTCTVCGDTYTEEIAKTEHTESEAVIENEVAATCTTDGAYDSVVYCAVCGEVISSESITVPATGHNYDDGVITKEATCTEDGIITYRCGLCGDTYTETVEATGHTYELSFKYVDGVGVFTYTCTVCGDSYTI